MNSWMKKYDEKEDLKREIQLKDKLQLLTDKINEEINLSKQEKCKILESIIETYKSLKYEAFTYDEEDYQKRIKELKVVKYELLQEKYKQDKEDISWEEYKAEEIEEDKER